MNKSSLIKISIVLATVSIAMGATRPQAVLAQETGTVPIIRTQSAYSLSHHHDNTTIPIIVTPSDPNPTANPGSSPYDETITITVTVNAAPTVATPLELSYSHPEAIQLPSVIVVEPGDTSETITATIAHGSFRHHKNVHVLASANGTTAEAEVNIHYVGEQD